MNKASFLYELQKLIIDRKHNPSEGSYTSKLFSGGRDRILKKISEESGEVIIAAKNNSRQEMVYESADLLYHLFVALAEMDIDIDEVFQELASRKK